MAHVANRDVTTPPVHSAMDTLRSPERSVKILAKSLFRELRTNGYDDRQIVTLSTELIGLLTSDIKEEELG